MNKTINYPLRLELSPDGRLVWRDNVAHVITDTDRLNWLEKTLTGIGYNVEVKAWGIDCEAPYGSSIREAIDAAMVESTMREFYAKGQS